MEKIYMIGEISNMKKIIILVIGILLLCGCDKFANLETYCDEEYGISFDKK